MPLTNFPNGVSSFGVPLVGDFPTRGNVFFLDPVNGHDGFDGKSPTTAFKTLPVAYAALTADQNDILYYLAGSGSISLSAQLVWAKNYTHFIGVCAPTRVGQRARIFQAASATGLSPLISITASGCSFKNLYIFQGVDNATSLIAVAVSGGRNYFENVHFAGSGHAAQAIDGGHSLKLDAAEECTFVNCTFGVDTVDAVDGVAAILMDTESHRNLFENCIFRMCCAAGDTGPAFVEVADSTGIDRDTLFKNCTFLNNSATSMGGAFNIPAGMGAPRKLLLQNCMLLGVTKLDANDRGVLFGNMNAVTAADLSGVAVQLVV